MLIPAIMSADIFNLAEELDKLLLLNIDALHVGVSTTLDQQPSLGKWDGLPQSQHLVPY